MTPAAQSTSKYTQKCNQEESKKENITFFPPWQPLTRYYIKMITASAREVIIALKNGIIFFYIKISAVLLNSFQDKILYLVMDLDYQLKQSWLYPNLSQSSKNLTVWPPSLEYSHHLTQVTKFIGVSGAVPEKLFHIRFWQYYNLLVAFQSQFKSTSSYSFN